MPTFDAVLIAATPTVFNVVGDFLRIKKRTGVVADSISVDLFKDGQKVNVDFSGCDAGDATRAPKGYDQIVVTSTVAQTVTFQVMRGQFESNKVVGEVSVISGEVARSKAGVAFWAYASVGAVAAQFGQIELWNPVASGKRIIVEEVFPDPTTAGYVSLRDHNAAFATLIGNAASKLGGAALSSAEIRTTNNAAAQGTLISFTKTTLGTRKFGEPIVVTPGRGLVISDLTANDALNADIQFYEEVI